MESAILTVAALLPDSWKTTGNLYQSRAFSPLDLDLIHIAKFLLFFTLCSLVLSTLGRLVLGKHSSLNRSLSSAIAILFIYAVTIVVYTFQPMHLERYLSPLPFVTFFGDYLVIMPVIGIYPTVFARELLSLIILAFLVNLLDVLVPQGKSILGWYCLRFFTVGVAMVLHLVTRWSLDTYLPNFLVTYAPMVLLLILVAMILLGFFNAVIGLVLTIANPIIGAIYAFFFSNLVGKQITKAVFTAGILCVILFVLNHYSYNFIHISMSALTAYIPMGGVCLILWYLIGHLL